MRMTKQHGCALSTLLSPCRNTLLKVKRLILDGRKRIAGTLPPMSIFYGNVKTAYYSAAYPLLCGAIVGGGTAEQRSALKAFGLKAGLAFQLQDDLLNLVGNARTQGKIFAPISRKASALFWWSKRLRCSRQRREQRKGQHTRRCGCQASYKNSSLLSSKTNDLYC